MSPLPHNISHLSDFLHHKSGLIAQEFAWCYPLAFASQFAEESHFAFLHSSQPDAEKKQFSLLALHPQKTLMVASWEELQEVITQHPSKLWIGNIEYEMGDGGIASFTCYQHYYLFDSLYKKACLFSSTPQEISKIHGDITLSLASENLPPPLRSFSSNMSKFEYLAHIRATLEQIHAGEFYQANITRKFFGEFAHQPDAFRIFCELAAISPAGYSAYIKQDATIILSSSPESFLSISAEGKVSTHPIKGTAKRSADAAEDLRIKNELAASIKNKSENLMIVDLMRNDLAMQTKAGSVKVENLYAIKKYPHLYHMVSTISAQMQDTAASIEVIRGCSPPGSMTGAPKKRVIEWCRAIEEMPRSIYSGSLGWLAGDGSADLSVVIRTIIFRNNNFEFQVGGGIVADSYPHAEWEETLTKANALCKVLHISDTQIAAI